MSYGSFGEGEGREKATGVEGPPQSVAGAFLNPGAALIIALSSTAGYIKRCDLMRARSTDYVLSPPPPHPPPLLSALSNARRRAGRP